MLVVLALGFATAAVTQAVGLSLALGAFLAGLIVSESGTTHKMLDKLSPLRDAFVALFFVTIGALVDPRILVSKPALWGAIAIMTMLGKFAIWTLIVWLFRYPPRTALLVGLGLTQIGEFSYVLVRVARDAQLVTDDMYHATLAASVITILLNGLLMKALPRKARCRRSRPAAHLSLWVRIQHASRRIRYSSSRHMATRSKPASQSAATAVLDAPNGERERVFDPFRHYGDTWRPISIHSDFCRPCPIPACASKANSPMKPAASTAAPWARSSCTLPIPSGGAGSRNAWKGPSPRWTRSACSTSSSALICSSRCCSNAISAASASRSKA